MNHIEAAARALADLDGHEWDLLSDEMKFIYQENATAALRAMMEIPVTDGMENAWWCRPLGSTGREAVEQGWRALLGAVLEDK